MDDYKRRAIRECIAYIRSAARLLHQANLVCNWVYPIDMMKENFMETAVELFEAADIMDAGMNGEIVE